MARLSPSGGTGLAASGTPCAGLRAAARSCNASDVGVWNWAGLAAVSTTVDCFAADVPAQVLSQLAQRSATSQRSGARVVGRRGESPREESRGAGFGVVQEIRREKGRRWQPLVLAILSPAFQGGDRHLDAFFISPLPAWFLEVCWREAVLCTGRTSCWHCGSLPSPELLFLGAGNVWVWCLSYTSS